MVRETCQGYVVTGETDALCKLPGRIAHAEHEERGRQIAYLFVEDIAEPVVEHPQTC